MQVALLVEVEPVDPGHADGAEEVVERAQQQGGADERREVDPHGAADGGIGRRLDGVHARGLGHGFSSALRSVSASVSLGCEWLSPCSGMAVTWKTPGATSGKKSPTSGSWPGRTRKGEPAMRCILRIAARLAAGSSALPVGVCIWLL